MPAEDNGVGLGVGGAGAGAARASPKPPRQQLQQPPPKKTAKKKKAAKEPVAAKPRRRRKVEQTKKQAGGSTLMWIASIGVLLALAIHGWQQNWCGVRAAITGGPNQGNAGKDVTREETIKKAEALMARLDEEPEHAPSQKGQPASTRGTVADNAAGSKLHEAALAGDVDTIARLAKSGANLDIAAKSGDTAATLLATALSEGEVGADTAVASIAALGKAGANFDKEVSVSVVLGPKEKRIAKYKESMLHMLIEYVERGRISGVDAGKIIAALAEGGANINLVDGLHKDAALHRAVLSRNLIRTNNPQLNPKYSDGPSGQIAMVAALAAAPGLDFAAFDDYGMTAVHRAALQPQEDPVNNPDPGTTAAIFKTLAAHGADLNALDLAGKPALHQAAGQGHVSTVRALIAAGCDMEATDKMGMTPLFHAVFASKEETIKELVDAGANLEAKSSSGQSLADVAEHVGDDEVTYIVLKAMVSPAWKELRLSFAGNLPIKDPANMTEDELKNHKKKQGQIAHGRKIAIEIREDFQMQEEEEAAAAAAAAAAITVDATAATVEVEATAESVGVEATADAAAGVGAGA